MMPYVCITEKKLGHVTACDKTEATVVSLW